MELPLGSAISKCQLASSVYTRLFFPKISLSFYPWVSSTGGSKYGNAAVERCLWLPADLCLSGCVVTLDLPWLLPWFQLKPLSPPHTKPLCPGLCVLNLGFLAWLGVQIYSLCFSLR